MTDKRYVLGIVAALLLGFLGGTMIESAGQETITEPAADSAIDVVIDYGDGRIKAIEDVEVAEDGTLFSVLERAEEDGELELTYEDYGGDMGVFLQAIDGVGLDDESRWWQYWVNGAYGTLGVSSETLASGDVILFVFTNQEAE